MRIKQLVWDLLFPPRCAACGTRLDLSLTDAPTPLFCRSCRLELAQQQLSQCPQCFAPHCSCRCVPPILAKAGCVSFRKLAPYGEPGRYAADRLVRSLKIHPRTRVIEACVQGLAPILREEVAFQNEKVPISHTVIAYLPRSRRKVVRYGFDQARELALALSKETGIEMLPLLKRVRDGKPQKGLSVRERAQNLRGAFSLRGEAAGLRVVLVDDVVTTGASMAEGTRTLMRGGAAQVICLSIAATVKRNAAGAPQKSS